MQSKVVLTLNEELLDKGYTIYADNFDSSPELSLPQKGKEIKNRSPKDSDYNETQKRQKMLHAEMMTQSNNVPEM
jgi:hypothetical protein